MAQHNSVPNKQHEKVAAWFLGPKAENFEILRRGLDSIILAQRETRLNYFPHDKASITREIKDSAPFQDSVADMEKKFSDLLAHLARFSLPTFSPRHSGHMGMENSIPASLGYLSAMLGFNPNNATFELSPVTVMLEIEVGQQLCTMLGYPSNADPHPQPWGHITCDGTVANLESIWAARNLKFYPLALRDAMKTGSTLEFIAASFILLTCKGEEKHMSDLSTWELLNLRVETILDIPDRLYKQYQMSPDFLEKSLGPYIIQTIGMDSLESHWNIKPPQILCSRMKHYSLPKSAALAGIGSKNVVGVDIDIEARMDIGQLEMILRECHAKEQAVYSVIAIIGTTTEGAVDPIEKIKDLRIVLQNELGLSFAIHADAAWGGYFASMLHKEVPYANPASEVSLSPYTITQLSNLGAADSITIDPHKSAYVPYPAGGLCYRDGRMKNLLTWTAPYVTQGQAETIGIYGVEGSKPGAAATSVWLSHEVIPLNDLGLGALLGQVSFTSRRFSAHWAAMSDDEMEFIVVPFNQLPVEQEKGCTPEKIKQQKQFIREHILNVENADLTREAVDLLARLGSNLNINVFACNFKINGKMNKNIHEANYLNRRIFKRLSITAPGQDPNSIPFYLTSTIISQEDYGKCATNFKRRLGLKGDQDLFVLRNVVMSPFTTTWNFVAELANTFRKVLEEEMKVVRLRNTITPDIHQFVVQGNEKRKYLVYQPMFKKSNSCYQVILSADIDFTRPDDNMPVFLENKDKATLEELCSSGFWGQMSVGTDSATHDVQVTNVRAVKMASLSFNDRSAKYPDSFMPFYLYGTTSESHISHLISLDPNIQLCASNVSLQLHPALSAADLTAGVVVCAHEIHEASMQPFPPNDRLPRGNEFFLHTGKKIEVSVFADPFLPSLDNTIRVSDFKHQNAISSGTITLQTNPYVDIDRISKDPSLIPFRDGMGEGEDIKNPSF